MAEVREALGAATILVNNAGISPFEKFLEIERESFERVFAVNLIGIFDCCQAVVPDMIDARLGAHREHRVVERADRQRAPGALLRLRRAA